LKEGHEIIGIDNFNSYIYDNKFKKLNSECLKFYKNYREINDDIFNGNFIEEHQPNIVIHLAAYANVRKSIEEPDKYIRNNVECTCKVLKEITNCTTQPLLIYASSSSVYGTNKKIPFEENDTLNNIISPYALSKKMCEDLVDLYCKTKNTRAIGLRFFTAYGPGGRPDMAIYNFLKNIQENKVIKMFGNGTMQRDYTYVGDIIEGIYSCIKISLNEKEHRIYNIGNNSPITLIKLIQTCEDVVGKKAILQETKIPDGDVPITYASIEKAKRELNYQPITNIYEGLKQTYNWFINLNI
jgi:UDP-glucuronate 4-epimerase